MIYLDHNATTPLVPAARAATLRALDRLGNPSSQHAAGRAARAVVETAREQVAAAIGANPEEVTFTSGGTESCWLAIAGSLRGLQPTGRGQVITTRIEHSAVLAACAGFAPRYAPLDATGRLEPSALEEALASGGASLLAVASANNEIGTRQRVPELAAGAHAAGALVFVDAVQSLGKEPVDVGLWDVDLMALSGHKIGGPKGIGAIYVRAGTPLAPLLRGGPQELERRAGTENVSGIAGFGAAAEALAKRLGAAPRVRAQRDRLRAILLARVPEARVHGDLAGGLPNTLNLGFPGCEGDALRVALDLRGLCVSGGSACASGAVAPSHVLLALGRSEEQARSAVRFSLGPETTDAEVERAAAIVAEVVGSLRG